MSVVVGVAVDHRMMRRKLMAVMGNRIQPLVGHMIWNCCRYCYETIRRKKTKERPELLLELRKKKRLKVSYC
jgi:hypothetical protein